MDENALASRGSIAHFILAQSFGNNPANIEDHSWRVLPDSKKERKKYQKEKVQRSKEMEKTVTDYIYIYV